MIVPFAAAGLGLLALGTLVGAWTGLLVRDLSRARQRPPMASPSPQNR